MFSTCMAVVLIIVFIAAIYKLVSGTYYVHEHIDNKITFINITIKHSCFSSEQRTVKGLIDSVTYTTRNLIYCLCSIVWSKAKLWKDHKVSAAFTPRISDSSWMILQTCKVKFTQSLVLLLVNLPHTLHPQALLFQDWIAADCSHCSDVM